MRIILDLVRHAQGSHNVAGAEQKRDPDLTDLGRAQCAELGRTFPHHDRLVLLAASPLRRTLETCLLSFYEMEDDDDDDPPAAAAGRAEKAALHLPPVVALPDLQEAGTLPSDLGTDVDGLRAAFEGRHVDLSRVEPGWEDKVPGARAEATMQKLEARAAEARRVLRELATAKAWEKKRGAASDVEDKDEAEDEVHVAVVSHGGFLHFLTGDWYGVEEHRVTGWDNVEYRSYEFVDLEGDDPEALLAETPESWTRRHGSLSRPSATKLAEVKNVTSQRLLNAWTLWERQQRTAGAK